MNQEIVTRFTCPKCKNKFRRGPDDRFGPAQIKCGKCGEKLATNLTEWAKLSAVEKISRGIQEFINPFHTNSVLVWLLEHGGLLLGISILLGFTITGLKLQPGGLQPEELKNWKEVAPFVIGGTVYVAIILGRLVLRIFESQKYTITGTPPTWN